MATTIFILRSMIFAQIPLFSISILITSVLIIITIPILTAALTMLFLNKNFATSYFSPDGRGNCILYQHIF